jgi:hypothetical protein
MFLWTYVFFECFIINSIGKFDSIPNILQQLLEIEWAILFNWYTT